MNDDYFGPDIKTVPVGWFHEAAAVAARAVPGGIAILITLTQDGFEIEARRGSTCETALLSFFDMAMEDAGNPFLRCIERAATALG